MRVSKGTVYDRASSWVTTRLWVRSHRTFECREERRPMFFDILFEREASCVKKDGPVNASEYIRQMVESQRVAT